MIYAQLAVMSLVIIAVLYTRYESTFNRGQLDVVPIPELKDDGLVISSNDTTKLIYGKKVILLRVKDSILFDKRDSLYGTFKK